ncbi:hypothetical protein LTR85_000635 [Meristemomyces frigidus]|nr:hypothetical protein LTR85_000635 [Meristemomyces frigidus]
MLNPTFLRVVGYGTWLFKAFQGDLWGGISAALYYSWIVDGTMGLYDILHYLQSRGYLAIHGRQDQHQGQPIYRDSEGREAADWATDVGFALALLMHWSPGSWHSMDVRKSSRQSPEIYHAYFDRIRRRTASSMDIGRLAHDIQMPNMEVSPAIHTIFAFGSTIFTNALVAVFCFFAAMTITYISSSVSDWIHKVDDEGGKWTIATGAACLHTSAAILLRWPGCYYQGLAFDFMECNLACLVTFAALQAAIIVGYCFVTLVFALFGILPDDQAATMPADTVAQRKRHTDLPPPRQELIGNLNRHRLLARGSDHDAGGESYDQQLRYRMQEFEENYDRAESLGENWDPEVGEEEGADIPPRRWR